MEAEKDIDPRQPGEATTAVANINLDHSPTLSKLFTALSKAQGEMTHAEKDAENTFLSKPGGKVIKYATLAACIDASRAPLAKHELSFMQFVQGEVLVSLLAHSSGEFITSRTPILMTAKTMQGLGSAITYARRYALCAMLGIASGDGEDDGNDADGRTPPPRGLPTSPAPAPIVPSLEEQEKRLMEQVYDHATGKIKLGVYAGVTFEELLPRAVEVRDYLATYDKSMAERAKDAKASAKGIDARIVKLMDMLRAWLAEPDAQRELERRTELSTL